MKDRLFLLKPNFYDQEKGPYFCPDCALVEGMLSFYPELKEKLELHYIDFPRPRKKLVDLLGNENQSAPKLILGNIPQTLPEGVHVKTFNGYTFIDEPMEICKYLAAAYGVGMPH